MSGVSLLHVGGMYSTTAGLTIAYNVGATAGLCYIVQVISGVVMVMVYATTEDAAYHSLDCGGVLLTMA